MQVGKSFIRDDRNKPCKSIVGYDVNTLYLWSIVENMPVGYLLFVEKVNILFLNFHSLQLAAETGLNGLFMIVE